MDVLLGKSRIRVGIRELDPNGFYPDPDPQPVDAYKGQDLDPYAVPNQHYDYEDYTHIKGNVHRVYGRFYGVTDWPNRVPTVTGGPSCTNPCKPYS